ncbi:MAG: hypothetical protein FWH21_03690 [Kiritimatiellaeota bacterium]|nr:hypothetical protein [Kiritimatiellota bacterium]
MRSSHEKGSVVPRIACPLECGGSPPLSRVGLAPRISDWADTRVRPYSRPRAGASPRTPEITRQSP